MPKTVNAGWAPCPAILPGVRKVAARCWVLGGICVLLFVASSGCTSAVLWVSGGWDADYQPAEQRARDSGRAMFIFYKDARPGIDDAAERALKSPPVKARIAEYVRCVLVKPYEPDRRYVAQFGVERAPALIVVRPDGSYHAHMGRMSAEEITAFLDRAKEPGMPAVLNRWVPREARYHWLGDINAAQEESRRTDRPVLVVYYRSMTRDWERMEQLLLRREVHARFAGMVHCRIGTMNPWAKAQVTPFGAVNLPAVVISRSSGTYDVLEMPTSYESIVRFADAARIAAQSPETGAEVSKEDDEAAGGS